MLDKIAPGTMVNIKVVKQPTNAAAAKTLARVLSKDASVQAENRRLGKVRQRNQQSRQRGGRQWAVRVVKQHPVTGRIGDTGTLVATMDVLRDLGSVERFVQINRARK